MTVLRLRPFPILLGALVAALLASFALATPSAQARARRAPRLVFLRCSTIAQPCDGTHRVFVRTGHMLVGARGLTSRARVEFKIRRPDGRVGTRRVGGRLRTRTRLLVRVPGNAISGRIRIVVPGPRYSNWRRIVVRRPPRQPAARRPVAHASAFDGNGMWIWYLSRAEGGDPQRIAARAKAASVSTVFVKSADGANVWRQFSPENVAALKAQGLTVCGWQYVYGTRPVAEAQAAAAAKAAGADCFVIDAETEYEGRYAQAQQYVTALRAAVGDDFPIGLTSFPYVHYHPAFPYSVFMGPGGATANLPQVYWKTIGTTVDTSLRITYQYNAVYKVPIYPLGQAYDGTRAADLRRFRQLAQGYGARGVSWWVWDYASASDWAAIGAELAAIPAPPPAGYPTLRRGSKGDLVVWAQQHLRGAGWSLAVDGDFGPATQRALREFQERKELPVTGVLDEATWPTLLAEEPATVNWVAQARATRRANGARAATAARLPAVNGPRSAALPARRAELPPPAARR